ncbi:DUF3224 domain-containing protein [Solihabitans fulvus]|uniref:DUF3224 domain-containing protein n=1 Tax=Solihabitans fulvus TaxID=1892852 RepID=A0A5B2XRV0_9PSEU|nr:DUF3224 domain-containing protein [Solihabitans fulvus]KAA2266106.1 DUF3224 domain-containing protein [Solihabitans fulvus]
MTKHAAGTFSIDSWDQKSFEDPQLASAEVTKTFRGDIEGTCATKLLFAGNETTGAAAYVGFERIIGSVHGKSGSFIMRHNAAKLGEDGTFSWAVVPGTGTEELAGLRGEGTITPEPDKSHSYTLDYDLD